MFAHNEVVKYIPEWFPGAGFQTKARSWKKLTREMVDFPFEAAKNAIVSRAHICAAAVFSNLFVIG